MAPGADTVIITIPGKPRAWARAGVRVVTPKKGKPFAHLYTDSQTRAFEETVAAAGRQAMGDRAPFDFPVVVGMLFRREPPKSITKARRAAMLAGLVPPATKPDCSNYAKGVEDALNGIAFIDDALIINLHVSKAYAETAGVDVMIRPWSPPAPELEPA